MNLNSARQAWHDCAYNPSRGGISGLEERCLLGTSIQATDWGVTAGHAAHSTLAGWIQSAIARLHPQLRVFGDFMYGALQDDSVREAAENVVYGYTLSRSPRMTTVKRVKLEFMVKGVAHRYRYMHQGGQSANPDPLSKPETFRAWLFEHYGLRLQSSAWARDWEPLVQICFECCEDLDRRALVPVAAVMYRMKSAA